MKQALFGFLFVMLWQTAESQDFFIKAKASLAKGDTTSAIKSFQDAVTAGQNTAEAAYTLGAIAFARHDLNGAAGYLQTAVKNNDEYADAFKLLGDVDLARKDVRSALANYRQTLKFAPRDPGANTALGMALLAADSVDGAIIQLTRATEYAPGNPAIYIGLGNSYLKQTVPIPALAISNYQKAIDLDPKNYDTRFKLAQVFFKTRQYTEAAKAYAEIIAIDTAYAPPYLELGKIYVLAKLYEQGVPPLRTYVRLQPKSVEGAAFYARALFGARYYTDAVKEGQRALKLDSANNDVRRAVAHSLVETAKETKDQVESKRMLNDALNAFETLRKNNVFKPEDQAKYGEALFKLGKTDEAQEFLTKAIATDSTNCDVFFNLGSVYMQKRDYASAAQMFEKRIQCDPRSISSYLNGAASYMQVKNNARARELLLKSLELYPEFLQGRLWLGRLYMIMDSLDQAKGQYQQVLQIIGPNPEKKQLADAGEAYYYIGAYYFQTREYARAVESFKKAMSYGNDMSALHLQLGQALLQMLDKKNDAAVNKRIVEESVKEIRRSVAVDPNNCQGHLWLAQGLVLSRVEGDDEANKKLVEEACGEYRKALRCDPGLKSDVMKGMERIGCQGK